MADPIDAKFQESYAQILRLARNRLARERTPVSTASLVHELYLDLRDRPELGFASRAQFLAYSSRAMRSLLVDIARQRLAQKRSADLLPLTLGENIADSSGTPEQMLILDEALSRLGAVDERVLRVAEMRVIIGMEVTEIAAALEVSEPTVKRDWQRAKAFLADVFNPQP
jgi:RNA polymerase sigma factor (TIGR02999 family)